MTNRLRLLLASGALFLAGPASACDMQLRSADPAAIAGHARDLLQSSAAIIDAEVISPTGGDFTAQLRPLRVLKGPPLPVFLVATPSDCDIAFLRAGERMRVVLSGGPDRFVATMQDNGLDYATSVGPGRLVAALDALLGIPRPAGIVPPGNEAPPPAPHRR
jgi:hypothetical protein